MKRFAVSVLVVVTMCLGTIGCAEKTQVKETKQTTTPEGTKTETKIDKVETTGDNPPATTTPTNP